MTDTNKSENGGCSTLLGILFITIPVAVIGGSGYGLYLGTTRYLDGAPLASSEVLTPILVAIIFLGTLASYATRVEFGETKEVPAEAPWEVRPNWQSDELTETSLSTQWIITAIVWNLFTFPFAAFVLYRVVWPVSDPEWGMYAFAAFILVFPAIGVGFLWSLIKQLLHERKYGTSTLVMETMPGRLGQQLEARVRTPIDAEDLPSEGVHIDLSCYERRTSRGRTRKILEWQEDGYVDHAAVTRTQDGSDVPVRFDLPADQPPSTPKRSAHRVLWELEVSAALSGLNYDVTFEIPVFPPEDKSV